ncbi:MAG: MFS transporter [Pyrinomonadaceae bacterium]
MSEPKRRPLFYGWVIVAISTLALLVSNGLSIGGIPVFYKPIQEDFLSLGTVTTQTADRVTGDAASLTFLLAGIFSLVVGSLIQRFSLKSLMVAGCFFLGGGLIFYSRATMPWQVYVSHSLLGLSLGLVGVMIQTVLIANWFLRRRGTAMGILLTGTSFGGVLIPLIARPLIASYGWRPAIFILSLAVWLILLPAIIFFVKDRASDIGENFDGVREKIETANENISGGGLTLGEAMRTANFWILSLCAAALFYPIFTTSQQFILHIQKSPAIGVDAATASLAQSFLFVTSVGGKFLFGWLSDRLPTARVMLICCGLMFLGTLILLGFLTADTVFLFLIPFGLGYGGTFVLLQLLAVEYFGLKDVGKILGALTVIETLGAATGGTVTGRLAAAAGGDYTTAFYGVTIAAGLAFVLVVILNFLPKPRVQ